LKNDVPFFQLSEICSRLPQSGLYKKKDFYGSGISTVHMGEMFKYDCIDKNTELQQIRLSEKETETFRLTDNDLLFGRRSLVLEGAGRCAYVGELEKPVCFESSMIRATLDKKLANNKYVFEWFRSPQGGQRVNSIITFTTVAGVKGSDVARLQVPVPDLQVQKEITEKIESVKNSVKSAEMALSAARKMKKELIENSFRE
jgi:type I restriction enzyme S subunit